MTASLTPRSAPVRRPATDPRRAVRPGADPFRRAREIGAAVGLAFRAGQLTPDQAWVASRILAAKPGFRAGLARYDATVQPAYRSSADETWVKAQIDRRRRYVAEVLAPLAGIPPDLAVKAASTIGLGPLFARNPGKLAI